VDITRALNDPNVFARHFRGESWTAWRVLLAALFGLPLGHDRLLFKQCTGRSVAPTSPCRALWEAHRKHFGQDGDPILVWQAATRAMNPSVPQSYIDGHMADDPARAQAEYGAQFRTDVETFISREVVDAAVVPGRHDLPRMEGVRYTGFVDPSGGSSDAMTLSVCHVETDMGGPPRAVIDLVREVKPPFSPDGLVAEFAALLKAYGISAVWGDRYAGIWPRERFAVHGVSYQVPKQSASDLYTALLPVLNSHRAELPDNPRLISQLCQLERHAGSTKDNVRHPPGGHDDVANAVAGAVVMALAAAVRDKAVPMVAPVVVSGGARYFPGSDTYTGAGVPATPSAPTASYDYNKERGWRNFVNSDGSIRGSRRGPWDI
jgi:hypothetical protein